MQMAKLPNRMAEYYKIMYEKASDAGTMQRELYRKAK